MVFSTWDDSSLTFLAQFPERLFIRLKSLTDLVTFIFVESMEVCGIEGDGERQFFKSLFEFLIGKLIHCVIETRQSRELLQLANL